MQTLSDDSIPLELAMKSFITSDEGLTVMHDLTSTQAMITSLINKDGEQSREEAINELNICVEKHEPILVELESNGGAKSVSSQYFLK